MVMAFWIGLVVFTLLCRSFAAYPFGVSTHIEQCALAHLMGIFTASFITSKKMLNLRLHALFLSSTESLMFRATTPLVSSLDLLFVR
jgi:hypothetical protein